MPPGTVASIDAQDHSNVMINHNEPTEVHLLLSTAKLIEMEHDYTFCRDNVKATNEKKFSSPQGPMGLRLYCMNSVHSFSYLH